MKSFVRLLVCAGRAAKVVVSQSDGAKQTMRFGKVSRCVIQGVLGAGGASVAKREAPQAVDAKGKTLVVLQHSHEKIIGEVISSNAAAAELPY